jgi:hypothetical protein
MTDMRVISADSHMTEPGDLWVTRLDRKYRDNAPRVIKKDSSGSAVTGAPYVFVGPGFPALVVAGVFAAGRSGEELREHMRKGYEAARPSGWTRISMVSRPRCSTPVSA